MEGTTPKSEEEVVREEMEKARLELERQSLIKRMSEGNDPLAPAPEEEPYSEIPTRELPDEAPAPDQVIDKEKLAA